MTSDRAQIVRVKIEEGKAGLFYATSPDLKGLLVAEPTIDALDEAIPQAIAELYEAMCGAKVVVTKGKNNDPEFYPWVAIPAHIARRVGESAAA
jgi:hypothetical protein